MAHRQFEDRGRIVIYMETRDINALTAYAKMEGRLLIPWARETLLRAISEVPMDEPAKPSRRRDHGARMALEGATEHTAKSNRLTCMCTSCVEYRRLQQIPLGGLKKKEKTGARD